MADPRLSASIEGVNAVYASFIADGSTVVYSATEIGGSAQVGLAVTLVAGSENTIQTVADAELVLGKLIKVEADGVATVQIAGGMTLPGGTSATLTPGKKIVGDLLVSAEGYIRMQADATLGEVAVGRGIIVSDDPTTAVEVYL
jgi:hypothetical protein